MHSYKKNSTSNKSLIAVQLPEGNVIACALPEVKGCHLNQTYEQLLNWFNTKTKLEYKTRNEFLNVTVNYSRSFLMVHQSYWVFTDGVFLKTYNPN